MWENGKTEIDMIDEQQIQVSLPSENSGEDPAEVSSVGQDEKGRGDTQNSCTKRLGSKWQAISIAVLMVLFCGVASILFTQLHRHKSLTAELQHMAEEIFTARIITKQLRVRNSQLKQLLNSTYQNFTLLRSEYSQLKLLVNTTLQNFTLLSAEKTQLSMLLNNTMQEKTQLQVGNKELNSFLNSTEENCNLVEEENRQLNRFLNDSLYTIALGSAENKRLRQLFVNEKQTTMQLEAENRKQRSILFSDNLSFLWKFCNKTTLECLRCLPGWVEHASRCFFLSRETEKWEAARRVCLSMGGDLAIVLNNEDQAFLTNLTFQFAQENSQENFHSAWIGLQDMVKEGTHLWVNGERIKSDLNYWRRLEPNNALATWDKDRAGQDCVAIVPPINIGEKDWLKSWDDIVCGGKRHYLCETMALSLS